MQNKPENPVDWLLNFLQKREITDSKDYYQQIEKNLKNIEPALVQQFYSIVDETRKQSFIRNLHARLVWGIDHFTRAKEPDTEEVHGELSDNQKSILVILENLCTFIIIVKTTSFGGGDV